eukprot:4677600-Prorocentrum_lima.AAC.1
MAPVTSTPHFGDMLGRAATLIVCFLVGFGYNDALSSGEIFSCGWDIELAEEKRGLMGGGALQLGAVRTKEQALSSSSKACLDMTNTHLLL